MQSEWKIRTEKMQAPFGHSLSGKADEGIGQESKESKQVRDTHRLESAAGGTTQGWQTKLIEQGALTSCRAQEVDKSG